MGVKLQTQQQLEQAWSGLLTLQQLSRQSLSRKARSRRLLTKRLQAGLLLPIHVCKPKTSQLLPVPAAQQQSPQRLPQHQLHPVAQPKASQILLQVATAQRLQRLGLCTLQSRREPQTQLRRQVG